MPLLRGLLDEGNGARLELEEEEVLPLDQALWHEGLELVFCMCVWFVGRKEV